MYMRICMSLFSNGIYTLKMDVIITAILASIFYCAKPLHKGVTRQLSPDHEGPSLNHMVHHPFLDRLTNQP